MRRRGRRAQHVPISANPDRLTDVSSQRNFRLRNAGHDQPGYVADILLNGEKVGVVEQLKQRAFDDGKKYRAVIGTRVICTGETLREIREELQRRAT